MWNSMMRGLLTPLPIKVIIPVIAPQVNITPFEYITIHQYYPTHAIHTLIFYKHIDFSVKAFAKHMCL